MKKLLTVIVVALASVTLAHAQLGIVAGYNSSSTKIKDAANDFKTASNWHAGVAYQIDFGSLALQPSLTYTMKGTNIDNVQYKTGYAEASVGVPPSGDQVSGLWQYAQRMGQPCRKTTKRTPGPSTVPKLSVECTLPFILPS